jgi:hypothetical protein
MTVTEMIKALELIRYNDPDLKIGIAVTFTTKAILIDGKPVLSREVTQPVSKPGTCPQCRHASHGTGVCYNMASDNDCACRGVDPR